MPARGRLCPWTNSFDVTIALSRTAEFGEEQDDQFLAKHLGGRFEPAAELTGHNGVVQ
jgi:hypothetical protein